MAPETETAVSNVVLVTIDSLRADAICAHDETRHTPVLEGIADRGTVFDRAFAGGNWTPFSFPSIMASRPVFTDDGQIGVRNVPTLPTVLSDAEVSTAGFNAANGFLTSNWGYDAGFDAFDSFVTTVAPGLYSRYLATHPTVEAWLQLLTAPVRRLRSWVRGDVDDQPFLDTSRMFDVEQAATSFIEETTSPFFLWVHYMDTHTPYVPAPRYIREISSDLVGTHRMLHAHTRTGLGWNVGPRTLADLRTLYQAAVRQVDASIGRLLETLSAADIADETAIIVAGDHGEEFQEHGHLAHYPKLYDELIHVPFLIDVPGAEHRRIDEPVGLDAIPPTVTALLDTPAPSPWQGASLTPGVLAGESPADDPIVSVTVRGDEVTSQPIPRTLGDGDLLISVRDRDWIYIENVDTHTNELYYRPADSTQQDDRSTAPTSTEREVIDRFSSIAADHAETIREQAGETSPDDMDDDLEARLEALGYR